MDAKDHADAVRRCRDELKQEAEAPRRSFRERLAPQRRSSNFIDAGIDERELQQRRREGKVIRLRNRLRQQHSNREPRLPDSWRWENRNDWPK